MELITTKQAAKKLGLSDSSVRRLIATSRTDKWDGPEIGVKIGHDWLIRPEDLIALKKRPKPNRTYKRRRPSCLPISLNSNLPWGEQKWCC